MACELCTPPDPGRREALHFDDVALLVLQVGGHVIERLFAFGLSVVWPERKRISVCVAG